MNITDFKRIITSFADRPSDLEFEKGQLLTEIRGELIQAKISTKSDVLYVEENGIEETAISWIKNRIACLPQLASRIIDYIPSDKYFVNTHGKLLDELEYDPNETEQEVLDTNERLLEILGRKIPGTSSIVYLTSDAGEGKTTLINHLAHKQATNFKDKKSDWLLLPVPLGGRPFLRFDDIVIASIVNNLRFRYFYYDSFIELVRLGLIVPAFDGFEEMFMQSSTGEALSATGGLINKLNSSGSMLIAARKAYFDYKSFSSQAKLLDNISSSVSFARMSIQRWNKVQFIEYAKKKGVENSEDIYNLVSEKLKNHNHPILTRPVLVKQLIDVFNDYGNVSDLIAKLESVTNYFPAFVKAIIEREANLKWIDTSGEPFNPILTIEQHYELLSLIAEEMWVNNSNCLKDSILDLITELYADQNKFNIQTNRQIRERIKQHALIVRDEPNNPVYRFDHEEFYEFFLGIVIGDKILNNRVVDIKSLLKKSQLPYQTLESVVSKIKSNTQDLLKIKDTLDNVIKGENNLSYAKENAGNLVIRTLSNEVISPITIEAYEFPINSLYSIKIEKITFNECHFQSTSLNSSYFSNCKFINCQFDRLEINSYTTFENVEFIDCDITSIFDTHKEKGVYDNYSIYLLLKNHNATLITSKENNALTDECPVVEDEDLELTEKALRRFIRQNTPINDGIFKLRLGNSADYFFKKILPDLLKHNILIELEYIGQGRQRRFKLGVTFERIENALNNCKGCYESFLKEFD